MSIVPSTSAFQRSSRCPGSAHGRFDAQVVRSEAGAVVGREKQIMRAGLHREIDAALLCKADVRQRMPGAFVGDVDLASGPFGEDPRTAHGLDGCDIAVVLQMRRCIGAAGLDQPLAAPGQDRRALGVNGATDAEPGQDFERIEDRAVRRARHQGILAAHVELERHRAGLGHGLELAGVVLADVAVDAEIDHGLPLRDFELLQHRFGSRGRRVGVRHIEHRGDAADRRGLRRAGPGFLVGEAWLAEVHVHVDGTRQDVEAARVDALPGRRHRFRGADGCDLAALHPN